ncbi:5-formyltetrahydrofolate cyclo-ligase [Salinarimonas ramus]|uniref:5-formyltetrahydrofolate cyclo-ligase n=1 Tax=Salinarimonas ramus TaxID=690164 RepID=A0A917Q9H4_9HYPH|nr:5-formyltetrahydrofolate cyclo-ligase [Salinarimonas ramus]GGK34170.1 5-formyltetrahydrofolate cyclo-ligase [Salinarimonas ramus]
MTTSPLAPSTSDKPALRREGLARRDALAPEVREAAARGLVHTLLALPELAGIGTIAGYWPLRTELDVRPALVALAERGHRIALPVVTDPSLVFRAWTPGTPLVRGAFGVEAPGPEAQMLHPQALLVPLSRFDRACHRIGYGKGHYDRALAALERAGPVLAIGVAFSVQEAQSIPAEDHDRRLDLVVTEAEIIRAPRDAGAAREA